MVALAELWLPILLSAVFVFVVSSLLHMVIPIHKGDFKKIANEDKFLDAMRGLNVAPGEYMFPCAGSMKEMKSPEMEAKFKQGPVGMMVMMKPGGCNIGANLLQWFVYSVVIGVFVAYVGHLTLARGADYTKVFQLTGAVAVAIYALSSVPNSIWKGTAWGVTAKFVFDGIVYGLVTAGTFGWLWPK